MVLHCQKKRRLSCRDDESLPPDDEEQDSANVAPAGDKWWYVNVLEITPSALDGWDVFVLKHVLNCLPKIYCSLWLESDVWQSCYCLHRVNTYFLP